MEGVGIEEPLLTDTQPLPPKRRVLGAWLTPLCPLQDGNVRLYSILGTSLKDEGKLLEAKGPVTDVAYSHDGAFLAVCDASKVVTVFSVADGYSVSGGPAALSAPWAVQMAGGGRGFVALRV